MDAPRHSRRRARSFAFGKSRGILAGLLLATALSTAIVEHRRTGSAGSGDGHGIAAVGKLAEIGKALGDPLQYFALRSPGARGSGALLQTKNAVRRAGGRAVKPHERVLALVRRGPPVPAYVIPDLAALLPGLGVPGADFQPPENNVPVETPGSGSTPSLPLSPAPPIIYPGGTPGGGTTPPVVPPPRAAVPEPSTWSTLILGIFLIGRGLRAGRRRIAKRDTRVGPVES